MKILDKCISWINQYKTLIILVCIYVTFFDYINVKYYDYVSIPILSGISQNYFVDGIFIFISLLIILLIIQKLYKGYYIKKQYVIYSLVMLGFYICIRCKYHTYYFESFRLSDSIKYFDIIFLILISPLILYLGHYISFNNKKEEKEASFLYIDEAIKKADEDILGRKSKVNNTVRDIQNTNLSSSVAFGIVGKWGDGKTSYMNLIKEKIREDKEYIIVDFCAWLNISSQSIIQDYFDTIETALKGYSVDLAKEIRKYGNSVLKISKNKFLESVFDGLTSLSDNSLSSEFKNTNEQLKKFKKKVIVFFDDVDRLNPNETFEVLKLIRNTASFDSFIYVVGYDKEYLESSLQEQKIPNPTKYCEKIFLKEYFLLPITKEQIKEYLKIALTKYFPKRSEEITSFFEDKNFMYNYSIEEITFSIQNIRDAKRFLNELIPDYKIIQEEVIFRDYCNIKLLKFSFYEVYELLYEHKNIFISQENKSNYSEEIPKLTLTPKEEKRGLGIGNFGDDVFTNSKIEEYIINELKYDNNKLIKIKVLLNNLFKNYYPKPLSINYNQNYYKYFKDELGTNDIPINEYKNALKLSIDELKKNISNWSKEGKIYSVLFYIYTTDVLSFENKNEYEKYIKILFYIANIRNDKSSVFRTVGVDNNYLLGCIDNYQSKIVSKYYNNISELRDFIKSILYTAPSPYYYEIQFFKYIQKISVTDSDEIILTKQEIKLCLIHYFKEYTQRIVNVNSGFWDVFWGCQIIEYKQIGNTNSYNNKKVFPLEIKNIFKEILPKFLDEFLVWYVYSYPYNDAESDNMVTIESTSIPAIFDSIENFIKYIKSKSFRKSLTKESGFLDEFLDFYEIWSQAQDSGSQQKYVPYEFKYPLMTEKLENHKKKIY